MHFVQIIIKRLFFYFWDIPECAQPRIFRKVSQDFGVLPAATGLETGILKFVLPAAVHPVTKFILESIRYSDNIIDFFKSRKEFEEVKEDLTQSLEKYFMGLKYCISSKQFDPKVMEYPKRGPEVIEKTMGLLWNVVDDTITATPK